MKWKFEPLTNQKAVLSAAGIRYSVGTKYWPLLRRRHTHSRGRPAQCPPCRLPLCLLSFLLRSPGCRDLLLPGAVTPSQDTSRLNKEKYFSKWTSSEFAHEDLQSSCHTNELFHIIRCECDSGWLWYLNQSQKKWPEHFWDKETVRLWHTFALLL